ncbi:Manganese/iron superoxide dismutase [Crassisporium funariophilum]|nr:Manganese/iron superoxide dismutase [Crassisporium funariophilum]
MASCYRLVPLKSSRTPSVLSSLKSRWGTRSVHTRRPLPYSAENGLGKFLPPPALQTLVDYQDGLLSRLNDELRTDTKHDNHTSVAQIAINYASLTERTLAFNYAVLALNNSFFLDQLAPPPPENSQQPDHQNSISTELAEKIRMNYGDLTNLKSSFSAAALGMFSSGWVWLVVDKAGHLGVKATFGPSTLLIRSRTNMNYNAGAVILESNPAAQGSARPPAQSPVSKSPPPGVSPASPSSGISSSNTTPTHDLHSRLMHTTPVSSSINSLMQPAGIHDEGEIREEAKGLATIPSILNAGHLLFPLFCVPVYEHAWMSAGFGVWGKEAWLKEFWTVLDWEKVSKAYEFAQKESSSKSFL